MMVLSCSLSFVLWSCLTFLIRGESLATQRQRAFETRLVTYGKAAPEASIEQLQIQQELVRAVPSKRKLGARKSDMHNFAENEMKILEDSDRGDASESTGTTSSATKCEKAGKNKLNAGCKLGDRNLVQMNFRRDGLPDYTADYQMPESHPPMHN